MKEKEKKGLGRIGLAKAKPADLYIKTTTPCTVYWSLITCSSRRRHRCSRPPTHADRQREVAARLFLRLRVGSRRFTISEEKKFRPPHCRSEQHNNLQHFFCPSEKRIVKYCWFLASIFCQSMSTFCKSLLLNNTAGRRASSVMVKASE
jgi:hypothetical protein